MKMKQKHAAIIRHTIAGLREEIENCTCTVELELGGIVNRLRSEFPKAPDRLLWGIALYDPIRSDKVRANLRYVKNLRRRIARLRKNQR